MKVELCSYSPEWIERYRHFSGVIARCLSSTVVSVDHIGSTSLKCIVAKPIVDILVGIAKTEDLDHTVNPMRASGFTYVGKFTPAMPYRRFFAKLESMTADDVPEIIRIEDTLGFGTEYRSISNIHVFVHGTYHWLRHIAVKHYMLAHPDIMRKYESLKMEISKINFSDMLEYNSHKEEFITYHQAKAMEWYEKMATRKDNKLPVERRHIQ